MKITPNPKYFVLKQWKEEKKPGVLIVPDNKGAQALYEIVETYDNASDIGKRVIIKKFGGQEVELNGEKLLLVHEDDILAVVHE